MATETIGVHVDGVSKRFAHRVKGEVYAARDVHARRGARRVPDPARPVGLRQDDDAAHDRGLRACPTPAASASAGRTSPALPANQRNIGFVFQNYALFPHLSVVRERRLRPAACAGSRRTTIAKRVGDVLALVGLARLRAPVLRASSPAASSSASRSRAPSSSGRACCCSTSRCPISTPSCACRCARRSATCSGGSRSRRST